MYPIPSSRLQSNLSSILSSIGSRNHNHSGLVAAGREAFGRYPPAAVPCVAAGACWFSGSGVAADLALPPAGEAVQEEKSDAVRAPLGVLNKLLPKMLPALSSSVFRQFLTPLRAIRVNKSANLASSEATDMYACVRACVWVRVG